MGSFSDYWENEILDHLFGKSVYTPPTIYVALSTSDPGEDGSGLAEPSGNGYARAHTVANDWTTANDGSIDNTNAIAFNTAAGDWGTITHFAMLDAAVGGNLLAYGALTHTKTVSSGDTIRFDVGDLDISLD